MAAITTTPQPNVVGRVQTVRTGAAQANTGQTDWLVVPARARFAIVCFNLKSAAGTSPTAALRLLTVDPLNLNDSYKIGLGDSAALATLTAAGMNWVEVGPGVTGIADDVTTAATGVSRAAINAVLPQVLGLQLAFDRTTGDETYTYSLSVTWR